MVNPIQRAVQDEKCVQDEKWTIKIYLRFNSKTKNHDKHLCQVHSHSHCKEIEKKTGLLILRVCISDLTSILQRHFKPVISW